ncbi:MAG: S1 family peptidase, partial [Blastocatellia bacterium]
MRANFSLTSGWMNRSVSSASAIAISIGAAAVIVLANITGLGQVRLAPPGNSRTEGHRTTSTTREHIRQAIASVGVLLVRNGGPGSGQQVWPRGSAVVVRKDGIIATNLHVVTQDNSGKPFEEIYFALPDEKHPSWLSQSQYRVRVLLASQRYDLALLEILPDGSGQLESPSRQFPAIQLGDSRHAKILDSIAVIGYPETGGTTVTANLGVVEGTD